MILRYSPFLLSFALLALGSACADRSFKGGVHANVLKKSVPAAAAAKASNQSGDASPETAAEPLENEVATTLSEVAKVISKVPSALEGTFKTSLVSSEEFNFSLDIKSGSAPIKIADIIASKTVTHTQNTRPQVTDTFKQGSAGLNKTESFLTTKQGVVDILVVIDNSGSMDAEQVNLAAKMDSLLTSIKDTNWQIGVITTTLALKTTTVNNVTTTSDACYLALIKSTDSDAKAKFEKAINAGITGSGTERGIRQAVNGLRCTENPWIRQDSTVAVLIVSDEDNCSSETAGECKTDEPGYREAYLEGYVESNLGRIIGKNAGFYGIFSPPASPCATALHPASQYQRLVDYKANGAKNYGNICDADFSPTLSLISKNIALLVSTQYSLAQTPDAGSLKLMIDNIPVPTENYMLAGQTITFVSGKAPALNKSLVATYSIGSSPVINKVSLQFAPAIETLTIKVNDALLPGDQYQLNGQDITFVKQPSALAAIVADYRVTTPALKDGFLLDEIPLDKTLKVTVNGKSSPFTMGSTGKEVMISPAAPDGASIVMTYSYRVGRQTAYSAAVDSSAVNIKLTDGAKIVPFTVAKDVYTIPSAEAYALGSILTFTYDVPDGSPRTFTLPHTPDAGSIVDSVARPGCGLGDGIAINGDTLTATCSLTARSDVKLSYTYTENLRSFSLEVPAPDKGKWEMTLDGAPVLDFTRVGSVMTLPASVQPKLDSLVHIRYTFPE
ncbi:MAG: hypothetical protein H7249_15395 [Chitinophagaceae bacterium]|nr:hypothetical protein [Oligoflexus sp.]